MLQTPAPSDGALVAEYLGGEQGSFEVLYRRFFPRLVRHCARVGAKGDAEDLAHETLLRARSVLPTFDTNRPMWPWLKSIATRATIDRGRRAAREIPVAFFAEAAVIEPGAGDVEERALLIEAMRNLTPAHATALRLRYVEDWSSAQAAAFLGLTTSAFKQLLYRARRRLLAEYRRLSGPLAAILLPLRRIRDWLDARLSRFRRGAERAAPYSAAAADGGLLAGLLALALVGGGASPAPPERAFRTTGLPAAGSEDRAPVAKDSPGGGRRQAQQPSSIPPARPVQGAAETGRGKQRVDGAAGSVVNQIINPAAGVDDPEDTHLLSVALSPSASDDSAFAVGRPACQRDVCPVVLFGSDDGGASWVRRAGAGLVADQLLLPPAYGEGDDRIFAMGVTGLQVSNDHGESFAPATVGAGAPVSGAFAISPGFNSGDPSILIGSKGLTRFRDDVKTVEPVPTTAIPSDFEPAYSPDHPTDSVVFLGGVGVDPGSGASASTVHRCTGELCSSVILPAQSYVPRIRLPADHTSTGRVYAFTEEELFVSQDHGMSFTASSNGWRSGELSDLVVGDQGELLAAVRPRHASESGGLFRSTDQGASWDRIDDPLLAGGASTVVLEGGRIIAARAASGVACSSDGGATWSARCPA
jgi:RNA polymerase sigma-70 factor, ECF subfamily